MERQYLDVCCISEPRTASEAKFSIAHMAALALAGRSTVSPETFTPAALADPEQDEHEDYLRWVGGKFEPEEFDPVKSTKRMRRGLPDWRTMR